MPNAPWNNLETTDLETCIDFASKGMEADVPHIEAMYTPKFIGWNHNPQIWLYLQVVPLEDN